MSAQQCRVAFVGAGSMARAHALAFSDIEGVELVGVHSRTRQRAEQLAAELGIARVFDSVEAMHRATSADLVIVAVSELAANAVCREVFRHRWTALVEKPAGYNLADALDIAAAAKVAERPAYVALNRRFYGSTAAALLGLSEASGNGRRFIQVFDQQDPGAIRATGRPEAVVRNWMFANSIHTIDLMRVFGRGAIMHVEQIVPWNPHTPGVVVSHVTFESGDIGLYQGVWNGPGPWGVAINTEAARWELRPLETASVQARGERTVRTVAPTAWDSTFKPGLRRQAEEAVAAALGRPTSLPTLGDGLETMRLIEAMFLTPDRVAPR